MHLPSICRIRELLRSRVGARLAFAMWSLWLSFPYWCLGPRSYVQIHDNADQMFSALVGYSRGVALFGFWAPAWATGVDWLSQGYTNNLYTIPFLLLPPWAAYSLLMLAQRFVAGYFMYLILQDLEVEKIACWYAGLAYSVYFQIFSPGFTLFKGLADAAFPLVVWAIIRKSGSMSSRCISAFAIGAVYALSSSFHLSLFAVILIVLWLLIFNPRTHWRHWIVLVSLFSGWLLMEIPSIVAAGMNAKVSQRSVWNAASIGGRLGFVDIFTDLLKYNLLSFLILLLAIAFASSRRKVARYLVVVLACSAAPLLWYVVAARFHSALGFLSGFSWERVHLIVPFLAIASAAIAGGTLSHVQVRQTRFAFVMPAAIALVIAQSLFLNASILHALVDGSNYAELYCNPDLLALAKNTQSITPPYRVASIGIHPAFMWAYGFETADGYLNVYPRRYQQFWRAVINSSLQQDTVLRDYFENRGSRIYLFVPGQRTAGALELLRNPRGALKVADLFNLNLLSLANVRYIISTVPLDDRNLILQESAVREKQIEWQKKPKFDRYFDVVRGRSPGIPLYIYENQEVLPRFFCAKQVLSRTPKEILDVLPRLPSEELLADMLIAEPAPLTKSGDELRNIAVRKYSADCIVLRVTSGTGCPLVITNSYSPYWQVLVDGQGGHVLTVDHAFQGVNVSPGEHDIELVYSPPYAPTRCR